MYMIPLILLTIKSPYFKMLGASWRRNRSKLLDTSEQLNFLLQETRTDVYNQFTEKQSEWKNLAKYTVEKKKEAKSDPRILHESEGTNRLKDAYYKTGTVIGNQLVYYYPSSKPYAQEHQEGATIDSPTKAKQKRKGKQPQSAKSKFDKLDLDFLNRFGAGSFGGLFD